MGDKLKIRNQKLLYELKELFSEVTEQGLVKVLQLWETIYGTNSINVVNELTAELKKHIEDAWEEQSAKLSGINKDFLDRISSTGSEAVLLEKALGVEPKVFKVRNDGPLVQMEEQLLSLLDSYKEIKAERVEKYFKLQKKEKELISILDLNKPKYKLELPYDLNTQSYVPTPDDLTELRERISHLEQVKEQLEYDFQEVKSQLRQLLEECQFSPITKEERCAAYHEELATTKENFNALTTSLNFYKKKKQQMMDEASHLRDQIDNLSKKMFKDRDEVEEFLSDFSGFSEATINKLKDKLKSLKEERRHNLKELIASSRIALKEWWDKCCYSEAQRKAFSPFSVNRVTEEVLGFHEVEIENLEQFYNRNKKIFLLAKQHEELWDRMLQLEDQANNKDRLFNNRGGCLLKEEKERKVIQKRVPAIKAELMTLLNVYKENTGQDFMYFGEPLQQKIEMKERLREMSKNQERLLRKTTNAENVMTESRLGARPVTGTKRKAPLTPINPNMIKSMRTETTTVSSSSSKSTASSSGATLVQKAKDLPNATSRPNVPMVNYVMRTPVRKRIPAASTPQNGSLSYESFQEHIEKSTYLAHNSTRNPDHQRVLRPKNLNQTRTVTENTTPYKTPKTPGKAFTKTPTKTPSRIPFRIPTGSKIPSQVPPISPRKPAVSTTKLPIIF